MDKKEIEMRNARAAQERVENIKEIAKSLYHWNAEMLFSDKCMLLPGDVCICGRNGGLEGSRGAFIPLEPDALADLIDRGALSRVFDPDDLNTPDFESRMAAVLHEFQQQRHFHDASCFYHAPELGGAIAVYDVPGPTPERDTRISVEQCEGRFELVPGVRHDVGTMAECTYTEFNPGNADILEELNGTNPERQNQSGAYERLMAAYQDGGKNDVPEAGEARGTDQLVKPEEIAGYDEMSPAEKLKVQSSYLDAKAAHDEEERKKEEEEDSMAPKLPGHRRHGV